MQVLETWAEDPGTINVGLKWQFINVCVKLCSTRSIICLPFFTEFVHSFHEYLRVEECKEAVMVVLSFLIPVSYVFQAVKSFQCGLVSLSINKVLLTTYLFSDVSENQRVVCVQSVSKTK